MQVISTIQTGKVVEFDFNALPEISKNAIIAYGAQRWINDRVNGFKNSKQVDDPKTLNAFADDLKEKLIKGELHAIRGALKLDPRVAFMIDFLAENKRATKKASRERVKEDGQEAWIKTFEASEVLQKEYKARQKQVQLDINLEELGL